MINFTWVGLLLQTRESVSCLANKCEVPVKTGSRQTRCPPGAQPFAEVPQPSTRYGNIYCNSDLIIAFEDDASVWVLSMMNHPTDRKLRMLLTSHEHKLTSKKTEIWGKLKTMLNVCQLTAKVVLWPFMFHCDVEATFSCLLTTRVPTAGSSTCLI